MGILNNTVSETQIKLKDRIWLYFIALLILFLLVVISEPLIQTLWNTLLFYFS